MTSLQREFTDDSMGINLEVWLRKDVIIFGVSTQWKFYSFSQYGLRHLQLKIMLTVFIQDTNLKNKTYIPRQELSGPK